MFLRQHIAYQAEKKLFLLKIFMTSEMELLNFQYLNRRFVLNALNAEYLNYRLNQASIMLALYIHIH